MERRLAALMAGDVVGYSAQMGVAEADTLARLARVREVVRDRVEEKAGRIFSQAGDGYLAEFPSPVSAVRAGFDIQRDLASLRRHDGGVLELRIGVHLADVVVDGDDLLGDGVNIAARVEGQAAPGSVALTQAVFDQVKRVAQLTFEEIGEVALKNISEPVRLYRVVDEIENHSYSTGTLAAPGAARLEGPEAKDSNTIAVLPFANMSNDPEQDYLADGMSEDLITGLAKFKDLFVVSRNASFAYRDRNVDPRQVGKELGVTYCLEGSVRKLGPRIRITGQLISTKNGEHVWADRHDCSLDDLFDVQDEIVGSIVSTVVGRMELDAAASARRKKPKDMAAYDCLMRGLEFHRLGGVTQTHAEEAVAWFDRAIEKDPEYGRAYAWRACALHTLWEWTDDPKHWDDCFDAGKRGIELDDNDAECHRIMGSLNLYTHEFDRASYHFQRALELNSNHAYIVGRTGELHVFLGEGEKALEMQRRAKKLDPFLPEYCRELEAVANYVLERYQETTAVVAQLPRLTRRAAAYDVAATVHLGGAGEIARTVEALLRIDPAFTIAKFIAGEHYKDALYKNRLLGDLAKAGLPE
jgi:TolB-like protein/class 3 adenylate cyclase/tetratricopeptide (TPR) repeat protein